MFSMGLKTNGILLRGKHSLLVGLLMQLECVEQYVVITDFINFSCNVEMCDLGRVCKQHLVSYIVPDLIQIFPFKTQT